MASSSRSYQTHLNFFKEAEKVSKAVQEDQEKEEDWLKLGLGFGSSTSSWKKTIVDDHNHISNPILISPSLPSSSQTLKFPQIGLGLEFEEKGSDLESRKGKERLEGMEMGWPLDHCYNDHYYHHNQNNDDNIGMVLWPSSSISCQIINPRGEDLHMPIPSDFHHYGATNNVNYHNQSGLWFRLRSFTNHRSCEALPQISKEYIRVKDENMTVLMVKKYLVTKLGLSNEAEIAISCMGESLSHVQTLKQVRDTIWLPRLVESVNSTTLSLGDSHDMTMNHLMSLIYQKHCILTRDL